MLLSRCAITNQYVTYLVRHARDNHELISHGVHVVHLELADPCVQCRVEQVHELYQLKHQIIELKLISTVSFVSSKNRIRANCSL